MKGLLLTLVVLWSGLSQATIDWQGEAAIVVKDPDSGFVAQVVPADMCIGLMEFSLAKAITQPFVITGTEPGSCSGETMVQHQINEAACAVVNLEYSDELSISNVAKIESVDISACENKSRQFRRALNDAIRMTMQMNGYTVDGLQNVDPVIPILDPVMVQIVVQNYHDGTYFLKPVPLKTCVNDGIDSVLKAVTQPVTVKANYGCGHPEVMQIDTQINEASCAVVTAVAEDREASEVDVRIDFSGCGTKASNSQFVNAVQEAVRRSMRVNFYTVVFL